MHEIASRRMPMLADKSRAAPLIAGTLIAAVIFAIVFAAFPRLDIAFASVFYDGNHSFIGAGSIRLTRLRNGFILLFTLACLCAPLGLLLTRGGERLWLGFGRTQWLYCVVCLAMGPGVVANLALKDQWGRARPSQIMEFGGQRSFSPAFVPSDQCQKNCSFVSGEASSIFILFYAVAFLRRRGAPALVVAGSALGSAAGLVRMAVGAHFLSDVAFAGVAMALTAAVVHLLFELVAEGGRREFGIFNLTNEMVR